MPPHGDFAGFPLYKFTMGVVRILIGVCIVGIRPAFRAPRPAP
jgi:hypothetical protein